jgi:hypothetical protein
MDDPSIETKVAVLESEHKRLCEDIHEMRVNHLPHIEQKLDSLIKWMMGALFTTVILLIGVNTDLLNRVIGVLSGS